MHLTPTDTAAAACFWLFAAALFFGAWWAMTGILHERKPASRPDLWTDDEPEGGDHAA